MHFVPSCLNLSAMTEPLALVFYEKLLPGQQLINRLHDLGYRTQAVTKVSSLETEVQSRMPMVLIAEFPPNKPAVREAFVALRNNPATNHVPILAYSVSMAQTVQESARTAGANLIASEAGLLDQLPHLLEQVLEVN